MAKKALFLTLAAFFLLFFTPQIKADELLDVQNQINQKNSELSSIQSNLEKVKKDILALSGSLSGTQADLDKTTSQVESIKKDLAKAEVDLEKKRQTLSYLIDIRNKQIRSLYQNPQRSPLELFLSNADLSGFSENLAYQSQVVGDSRKLIKLVNTQVQEMEKSRNDIAQAKSDLEALSASLASKVASLKQSYNNANSSKAYLSNKSVTLKSSLAGLSQKQNELIAAKIGNSIATGDLALADDANARVSFNPPFSPAFAAFSFGAYTHRNGMSQYGALGRANSGQNAEQILGAYYSSSSLNKSYPLATNIVVNGTNEYGQTFSNETMNFEEYIKHLYEVPSSWPMEVLKAQAVAARSYAVAYTNNGQKAICPSQGCQVVKKEINASSWQQAVEATRGWVLTGGNNNFQFSSTSGGYLNTYGWDTTSRSMGSWPGGAYESIGGSPWFYKGWYKSFPGNATCGRSHPWLTQAEFVDILNSWVVYTKLSPNDPDKGRVVTTDTACWGGNPYSVAEMKARADQLGGSYSSVTGAPAMTPDPGGFTSSISLYTDRGPLTIDGQVFRDIFNLRAPGYLVIKTPLYNIERK